MSGANESSSAQPERHGVGDRGHHQPEQRQQRQHQHHPERVMLSPNGSASTISTSAWTTMIRMSRSVRPSSSAKRLTGVTRRRSMTPPRSSAISPKPTPEAPNRPSWISRPGHEHVVRAARREAGRLRDRLQQRREQDQVQHRLDHADDHPHRVAQEDPEVAPENQPGVASEAHAAFSLSVSRSEWPVCCRNTSSRLGRLMAMVWSWKPAPSSSRSTAGMAASPRSTYSRRPSPSGPAWRTNGCACEQHQRPVALAAPGRG